MASKLPNSVNNREANIQHDSFDNVDLEDAFRLNDSEQKMVSNIKECWRTIGLPKHEQANRIGLFESLFHDSVSSTLKEGLTFQLDYQKSLEKSVNNAKSDLKKLELELGCTSVPLDDEKWSKMTLFERDKYYQEVCLRPLEDIKADRKKNWDRLIAENNELAKSLGVERFESPDQDVRLRIDVLNRLAAVNKEHTAALSERKHTMLARQKRILALSRDLETTPTVSFEDFTALNMSTTERLEQELFDLKLQLTEEVMQLREKCQIIRARLKLDEDRDLEEKTKAVCPTSRDYLRDELIRLEVLKKENMTKFVEELRTEMRELYHKCFSSPEDQQALTVLKSETGVYDEASLEEHEKECNRLRQLYKYHTDFFTKIVRREEVWKKKMEMDEKESDPARLLNRGGQLLRDQQEKARIEHELKKLDAELIQKTREWEVEHKHPFTVYGRNYEEFVEEQRSAYHSQQENRKEERRRAKEKEQNVAPFGKRKNEFPVSKPELSKLAKGSAGPAHTVGGIMVRSPASKAKRFDASED